jgi:hypothetical protein
MRIVVFLINSGIHIFAERTIFLENKTNVLNTNKGENNANLTRKTKC